MGNEGFVPVLTDGTAIDASIIKCTHTWPSSVRGGGRAVSLAMMSILPPKIANILPAPNSKSSA